MKRIFAVSVAAAISFSLAACGQNVALSESVSAAISESAAGSSAESAAESSPVSKPTAAPSPTPAPTSEPTETPSQTEEPTPVPETKTSQPEQPQPTEPQQKATAPADNAPAENAAPAPNSGHGVWTVFGDGQAYELINELRASLGLSQLTWSDSLGDIADMRCKQLMDDFSHNGMAVPEICALGTPDAASTVAAWTGSSAHYACMTNTSFTQIAVTHCYDGDGCHYWCACFS